MNKMSGTLGNLKHKLVSHIGFDTVKIKKGKLNHLTENINLLYFNNTNTYTLHVSSQKSQGDDDYLYFLESKPIKDYKIVTKAWDRKNTHPLTLMFIKNKSPYQFNTNFNNLFLNKKDKIAVNNYDNDEELEIDMPLSDTFKHELLYKEIEIESDG